MPGLELPAGWRYRPLAPAKTCAACGHAEPMKGGEVIAPDGRRWPLVGHTSQRQEEETARQVVAGNGGWLV